MADVRVGVKIQAAIEGLAQVRQMVQSIDGLGTEGQSAARELDALTRELEEIARTQGLIQTFKQQKQALAEVSREYTNARQRSSELGQALKQTADPTRRQTQEFEKARAATRQFATAQQQAQQALQQSRGALQQAGVSTQQLATAQRQLSTRSTEANTKLQSLNTQVKQLAAAKPAPDVTKNLRSGADSAGGAIRGVTKLLGAIGVTVGLAQVIKQFTDAAKSAQRFERALNAITGSAAEAEAAQQRLAVLAEKYGVNVVRLEDAYVSWRAAVEGTNLAGKESEDIFEAVAGSMSVLGRSTGDTEGALLALQQMVSKGAVSMEELRQQLGERLPGAFQLAAKGMGVSTAELAKMVATGTVLAEDLLPGLARELRKTYGLDNVDRVETLNAAQNRLTNSVTDFFRAADQATGVTGLLSRAIDGAADFIGTLADEMGGAKDEQKALTGEIKAGEQARAKLIEDADGAAIAMERQAAAAREAKDAQRDLNQEARDQAIATLRGEMELLSQAWERQNATIEQARAGIAILLDQGYSELDAAVRNQRAVVDIAEQSQANLGRRYNATAQQIREILNPALREQAEAQADAAEAADKGAEDTKESLNRVKAAADALGLSYNQAANKLGSAVKESGKQLKTLADAGIFTSKQLREAFSKALDTSESRADVEFLKKTLEDLAEQGAISGAELTKALDGVEKKLKEVSDESVITIGGITAAFDGSLESVKAVLEQLEKLREENKKVKKSTDDVTDSVDDTAAAQRDAGDAAEESGRKATGGLLGWQLLNEAQKEYAREALGLGGIVIQQGNEFDETATRLTRLAEQYEQAYFGVGDYAEVLRRAARENRALADAQRAAGDETVSYRIRLAELRGEEEEVLRLRQQQIKAQLELELLQAQTEGDLERVKQIKEVIRLQAEVAEEEKKQWKERQQEREREGNALDDQEKTHGRIGSQLNKQIGQRREIAYLEEQVASRADTTAKALDRQAAAGESAQRAIQSLGSADIGQLQRSIDALVQALQEGIGRGAQQARADIQALDAVDLRNLRGELAGLTEALTTDLAAGVRDAVAEMGKLNSTLLSDLRSEMSDLGRDLADSVSDAQQQATSRENVSRALQQAADQVRQQQQLAQQQGRPVDSITTVAEAMRIANAGAAIHNLFRFLEDFGKRDNFSDYVDGIIRNANTLNDELPEGTDRKFEAFGKSFSFVTGDPDSLARFTEQIRALGAAQQEIARNRVEARFSTGISGEDSAVVRELEAFAAMMRDAIRDGLTSAELGALRQTAAAIAETFGDSSSRFRVVIDGDEFKFAQTPHSIDLMIQELRRQFLAPAESPTATDIGTAVAGALAGAPLVIQIDGQALTGAIVQQLQRAAGQAN